MKPMGAVAERRNYGVRRVTSNRNRTIASRFPLARYAFGLYATRAAGGVSVGLALFNAPKVVDRISQ